MVNYLKISAIAQLIVMYYLDIFITLSFSSLQNSKKNSSMEFEPKTFHEVKVDTDEPNLCSPSKRDPRWRGILIKAPDEVSFSVRDSEKYIPICGYFQIAMQNLSTSNHLKLNVIIPDKGKVFSGYVVNKDPHPVENEPYPNKIRDEDLKGMALGSYFNSDLLNYVEFPLIPGYIEVFAELGGMKSNSVKINIKLK